jgi:hypothetical protein
MGNFVSIREQEGQIDFVNRDMVTRVLAEQISVQDWVVKVVLVGGLEIIDSRSKNGDEAAARVAEITGEG